MKTIQKYFWFLDIVLILSLFVFVISGVNSISFHGDEPMYIYMSRDFNTAFLEKRPMDLMTKPPYDFEIDSQLRILNGSVNRYVIGLIYYIAGIDSSSLPPRPGWNWGLDYEDNLKTGHLPSDEMLFLARVPSAVFLGLSSIVIFLIGLKLGRRPLAYFVSVFYTLNPIVLLNGRRAMMEGYLLFFGLTSILFGILISQKRAEEKDHWIYWLGFIIFSGLALASKQTAIIFVVASCGWIFVSEIIRYQRKKILETFSKLFISVVFILSIFIILSPALWSNPYERMQDLVKVRETLIGTQVAGNPLSYDDRVKLIIFQPFINPVAHFELSYWEFSKPIALQIVNYNSSLLSGFHFGKYFGSLLTVLTFIGVIALIFPKYLKNNISSESGGGLMVWLFVTVVALMANPLPWQRYYLPLIPVFTILSGIGLISAARSVIEIIDKLTYHSRIRSYEKDS